MVLKYFHEMKSKKIQPDEKSFNVLIDALGKLQDMEAMHIIYSQMKKFDIKPSTITFTSMINAFAKFGDLQQALKLYNDMKIMKVSCRFYFSILFQIIFF